MHHAHVYWRTYVLSSIYVELADQYKLMDAVSNVAKRNIVAGNLREVIDILEQKVKRSVSYLPQIVVDCVTLG